MKPWVISGKIILDSYFWGAVDLSANADNISIGNGGTVLNNYSRARPQGDGIKKVGSINSFFKLKKRGDNTAR